MTYDAKTKQQLANDQAVRTHDGATRLADDKSKAAIEQVANWAWSPSYSPYDWMDSHAPFAGLD